MTVVTNGERIEAALPAASLTDRLTRNARVVDLVGRFLLSGLNLVVLARDPTADIANMRSILLTAKRGRRFERSDYRPITRAEIPDDD